MQRLEGLGVGRDDRHRRPTTTRSMPARSRCRSTCREARGAQQRARPPAPGPAPTSTRRSARRRAGGAGPERRTTSSPSAPAKSATRGLVARDLRRQRRAVALRDVGRVGRRSRRPSPAPSSRSACDERDVEPEPRRVGARDGERVRADVASRPRRGRAARPSAPARRRRCPCRRRRTRAPLRQARAPPRPAARSPAAARARARRPASSSRRKPSAADEVGDRLALDRPAAHERPGRRARRRP